MIPNCLWFIESMIPFAYSLCTLYKLFPSTVFLFLRKLRHFSGSHGRFLADIPNSWSPIDPLFTGAIFSFRDPYSSLVSGLTPIVSHFDSFSSRVPFFFDWFIHPLSYTFGVIYLSKCCFAWKSFHECLCTDVTILMHWIGVCNYCHNCFLFDY